MALDRTVRSVKEAKPDRFIVIDPESEADVERLAKALGHCMQHEGNRRRCPCGPLGAGRRNHR